MPTCPIYPYFAHNRSRTFSGCQSTARVLSIACRGGFTGCSVDFTGPVKWYFGHRKKNWSDLMHLGQLKIGCWTTQLDHL